MLAPMHPWGCAGGGHPPPRTSQTAFFCRQLTLAFKVPISRWRFPNSAEWPSSPRRKPHPSLRAAKSYWHQHPVRFANPGWSDRSRATQTATLLIGGLLWFDAGWLKCVLFAPTHCNPGCQNTQIERRLKQSPWCGKDLCCSIC